MGLVQTSAWWIKRRRGWLARLKDGGREERMGRLRWGVGVGVGVCGLGIRFFFYW